jgi:hypothetical protein
VNKREEEDVLPWRLCWRDSCTWIFLVELGFDDLHYLEIFG